MTDDSKAMHDGTAAPETLQASAPAETPAEAPAAPYSGPDGLHDLFAAPTGFDAADDEDPLAQLRNDPNYSALIRELEYIAVQARALFEPAAEEPSDALWDKIQSQLPRQAE